MNEQNDQSINPMQATEAVPVQESSRPASVVIAEQQSGSVETAGSAALFVP